MNTTTHRRSLARLAALISSLLMMVGGIGAVLTATAPSASAATGVYFCAKHTYGEAFANRPVQLWQVNSAGGWIQKVRDGRTGSNGCATFGSTPSGVYLRVKVADVWDAGAGGQAVYSGASRYIALPGSGTANVGTFWVNRISCWGYICSTSPA